MLDPVDRKLYTIRYHEIPVWYIICEDIFRRNRVKYQKWTFASEKSGWATNIAWPNDKWTCSFKDKPFQLWVPTCDAYSCYPPGLMHMMCDTYTDVSKILQYPPIPSIPNEYQLKKTCLCFPQIMSLNPSAMSLQKWKMPSLLVIQHRWIMTRWILNAGPLALRPPTDEPGISSAILMVWLGTTLGLPNSTRIPNENVISWDRLSVFWGWKSEYELWVRPERFLGNSAQNVPIHHLASSGNRGSTAVVRGLKPEPFRQAILVRAVHVTRTVMFQTKPGLHPSTGLESQTTNVWSCSWRFMKVPNTKISHKLSRSCWHVASVSVPRPRMYISILTPLNHFLSRIVVWFRETLIRLWHSQPSPPKYAFRSHALLTWAYVLIASQLQVA